MGLIPSGHWAFVAAAYAVCAVALGWLVLSSLVAMRRAERAADAARAARRTGQSL